MTRVPSVTDGVEEEREIAAFDALRGGIWVTAAITPERKSCRYQSRTYATKPKRSLVPIYISSPTPSSQSSSKPAGVGVILPNYELVLEFNGVGGGEFQFLGEVGNPHAPWAADRRVGWKRRKDTPAGFKSTVAVGERIGEGEGGHA